MSIEEKQLKIKGSVDALFGDPRFILALIIILVAVASFGLGRLSVAKNAEKEIVRTKPQEAAAVLIAEPPREEPAVTYVASKDSTKYHLPWCSGAERISEENKIWFASKEEAEAAGYTPAGNCNGL